MHIPLANLVEVIHQLKVPLPRYVKLMMEADSSSSSETQL